MQLNNHQVVLGAIFFILLGGLTYNLSSITGHVVLSTEPAMYLSPRTVHAGGEFSVVVEPGKEGLGNEILIYHGSKRITKSAELCDGRCMQTIDVQFPTSTYWAPGIYTVKVYDYTSSSYLTNEIRIE